MVPVVVRFVVVFVVECVMLFVVWPGA